MWARLGQTGRKYRSALQPSEVQASDEIDGVDVGWTLTMIRNVTTLLSPDLWPDTIRGSRDKYT